MIGRIATGVAVGLTVALLGSSAMAAPVRIKDLVEFDGVRGNDLVGYGLVVGLNGTGDGMRNAPFTEEIMTNILERLGVNVTGEQFRPKNVAAVLRDRQPAALCPGRRPDRRDGLGDRRCQKPAGRHADHDAAERGGWADLCGRSGHDHCRAASSAEGDAASVVQGVPTAGRDPVGRAGRARDRL